MKLLVTRHGEARHNIDNVFGGVGVDTDLTSEGIKTARMLGEKISKVGRADTVVCSPLRRSRQTAEIISQELGNVKIVKLQDLKEADVGKFEGLTREEAVDKYPLEAKYFFRGDIEKWNFPDGESFDDLKKRADKALREISKLKSDLVVVCGHGIINRVVLYCLKTDDKLWKGILFPHSSIVELEI